MLFIFAPKILSRQLFHFHNCNEPKTVAPFRYNDYFDQNSKIRSESF